MQGPVLLSGVATILLYNLDSAFFEPKKFKNNFNRDYLAVIKTVLYAHPEVFRNILLQQIFPDVMEFKFLIFVLSIKCRLTPQFNFF